MQQATSARGWEITDVVEGALDNDILASDIGAYSFLAYLYSSINDLWFLLVTY